MQECRCLSVSGMQGHGVRRTAVSQGNALFSGPETGVPVVPLLIKQEMEPCQLDEYHPCLPYGQRQPPRHPSRIAPGRSPSRTVKYPQRQASVGAATTQTVHEVSLCNRVRELQVGHHSGTLQRCQISSRFPQSRIWVQVLLWLLAPHMLGLLCNFTNI